MTDRIDLDGLVRALRGADPADVPEMMASAAATLGGRDVVLYLVDFEQQVLEPLPDHSTHEELPHAEEVGTTIAGRAFLHCRATTAERPDGTRVWVPIIEGSDPTGVLALTITSAGEEALERCEDLGVLAGYLIATQARVTDLYNLRRRRRSMSLAASLQWDLLPPLNLASRRVTAAGRLEPAYDIGGDCFDYALNGAVLDVAIMDSMGHGLRSAIVAGLAMGCYRHDRREGQGLVQMHENLDAAVLGQCDGSAFVTGQIGQLDLASGVFTWINAGHPEPLRIRHGQVIGPLEATPCLPWGLGPGHVELITSGLEPGDSILFYTDGIVEARGGSAGDFGSERLADLVGQYASDQVPVGLIVRHLVRAVLEFHGNRLHDDATVLMVHWPGPAAPLTSN
jgi:serine phosphatase RsbU (regulator of sigma subunit)